MNGEKDFLDEFADEGSADVAPVIERPLPTEMEPAGSGRQRGPDGKFIKAEAQRQAEQAEKGAQEAVQTAVTEPPSDDDETGTVPIHVLKALRKEIQALKAERSAQPQPKAPEFNGPQVDFDKDPRSYLEQTLHAQKMQMSMFMATQQNDEATVQEAWSAFDEACRNDPAVSAYSYTLLNHQHPMGELVKWYKRETQLRMLNEAGGLEALIQQRMGQGGQPAPQGKPSLPPSLAGTGKVRSSEVNTVDADPFDALFKKR
jgi:hypothetical protein